MLGIERYSRMDMLSQGPGRRGDRTRWEPWDKLVIPEDPVEVVVTHGDLVEGMGRTWNKKCEHEFKLDADEVRAPIAVTTAEMTEALAPLKPKAIKIKPLVFGDDDLKATAVMDSIIRTSLEKNHAKTVHDWARVEEGEDNADRVFMRCRSCACIAIMRKLAQDGRFDYAVKADGLATTPSECSP